MDRWSDETFTASDGYSWHYRRYYPPGVPLAEVVCIHGIQSHAGWYEHSCERLRGAGLAVSFLDRRGSGLNEEQRGDAPSFRRLLDDLVEFLLQPLPGACLLEDPRLVRSVSIAKPKPTVAGFNIEVMPRNQLVG